MKRGNENKPHIAILGRCNAGKSTLLNFLSGDDAAIVSSQSGTTTDPVKRSIEILDFAPVVMIDTAGIDDSTVLGNERRAKSMEAMSIVDLAIIVYRGQWSQWDEQLKNMVDSQGIACVIIHNADGDNIIVNGSIASLDIRKGSDKERSMLLNLIKQTLPEYSYVIPSMFGDNVSSGNIVILVCPIDSEAPAGRLILPQVQAIRDLLDKKAIAVVVQPQQLTDVLDRFSDVGMVVTDSQIIDTVRDVVGKRAYITTFSILLAALKGDMQLYRKGLQAVDTLKDGDRILILESCLHQTSCEDIGRVKIPMWLREYSGKELEFDFVSRLSALPQQLEKYALAVQCGGCMVTRRQLQGRIHRVAAASVPITNYGMLISKIK